MANPGVSGSQIPAGEDFAQRQIKDLQRDLRELAPSIAKSFAPVIARLDAADAAFAVQQAALVAQQATLTTTVAGLASAVANIAALVADQVAATAGNATTGASAVSIGTSAASFATMTINVPAGFTVAIVNANSAGAVLLPSAGDMAMITQIGGANGPQMNANALSSPFMGNGASNFSRVFAVTSGGTFTVRTVAWASVAGGTAVLTTSAGVTFYR